MRIAVDRRTPTPVLGNGAAAAATGRTRRASHRGGVGRSLEVSVDTRVDDARVRRHAHGQAPPQAALDQALEPDVLDAETVEDLPAAELPEPTPGSRRSRRRNDNGNARAATERETGGEHTTGLSVAEIMANLRAESGAEPLATAGRRRK